jgi:NTP pyrophosphatase (non-canonical NTP hydrolase)
VTRGTILQGGRASNLATALAILADTQKLIRVNPTDYTGLPTKEDVRQYAFALCGEVHELADELHWKSWQVPKPIDKARVADELADVLAFLGVIVQFTMDLTDLTSDDLAEAYRRKTKVNMDRMAGRVEGYGGAEVQALPTNPRELQLNHYYTIKVGDAVSYGLFIGYDAKAETYWFRELITGKEFSMVGGEAWSTGAVEGVASAR